MNIKDNTNDLEFEELPDGSLYLPNFDSALTYLHTVDSFSLKMVQGLSQLLAPQVRLHRDHVLLTKANNTHPDSTHSLVSWLKQQGFNTQGSFQLLRTSTAKPVENGYFSCLRVLGAGLVATRSFGRDAVAWQVHSKSENYIERVLEDFAKSEIKRICHDWGSCMAFLQELYPWSVRSRAPQKILSCFDPEDAFLEFAASVWSSNELIFWSRPVVYPK